MRHCAPAWTVGSETPGVDPSLFVTGAYLFRHRHLGYVSGDVGEFHEKEFQTKIDFK